MSVSFEGLLVSFFISQTESKMAQQVLNNLNEGFRGLKAYLRWKKESRNIAVTGKSGSGKSTFINTLRGLEPKMSGAAKVGVKETTMKVERYTDLDNENLILSDLPGVGTPNFPRDSYLRKVGFKKFDFFLIISSGRFTENDLWLANQVKKQKKTVYFIRTKIDIDIKNDKEDHPHSEENQEEQEKALMEMMKSDCRKELAKGGLGVETPVFLISGKLKNVDRWDFPLLREKLIATVPAPQCETLTDNAYSLSGEEMKKAQEVMDKEGIPGLKVHIQAKLDAWKNIPLNIAVTGQSGSGKSTLINTMRGLEPTMPGAAMVGVTETTMEVKKYPDPKNENFVLSDLPGVGTPNFPQRSYLRRVEFQKFDFFLIICSDRFSENDLWLANQVRKQGKKFYFIRSKIDIDIVNDREDNPHSKGNHKEQEKAIMEMVKSDCRKELAKVFLGTEDPIFVISGKLRCIRQWDFPGLQEQLITSAPELKREALILSLQCNSKQTIDRKVEALKARILRWCKCDTHKRTFPDVCLCT